MYQRIGCHVAQCKYVPHSHRTFLHVGQTCWPQRLICFKTSNNASNATKSYSILIGVWLVEANKAIFPVITKFHQNGAKQRISKK